MMQIKENKIKENIKNIAYFALYRSNKVRTFKELEYDFQMSKEEIINILDLFGKAKIFYYKKLPLESEDDNYDFGSVRRRIEFYTGRLKLFFNSETIKILSLENKLYARSGSKILNGMTHLEIKTEIEKLTNQRNAYNESKKGKKHKELVKQTLEKLINSPKARNDFLRKYAKHLKLTVVLEDSKLNIGKLDIDLHTGKFSYFSKKGTFNPRGKEYKVMHTLIKSHEYQSTYGEILSIVYPDLNVVKSNRDQLYTIIKKINTKLGILPKSKTSTPNFIENVKELGYRLIIK